MVRDTRRFVSACPICAAGKGSNQPPAGLLQLLSVPSRPWSHIAMDFVTGLPLPPELWTEPPPTRLDYRQLLEEHSLWSGPRVPTSYQSAERWVG